MPRVPRPVFAVLVLSAALGLGGPTVAQPTPEDEASITEPYRAVAAQIATAAQSDHRAFELLTELCDGIGARLSGSPALDAAIAWAAEHLRQAGHENVAVEPVEVPHWDRGQESLVLVDPAARALAMIGLGGSVATPPDGLRGEVVVVHDWDELAALGEGAAGKVVLFDVPMPAFDPETRDPGYGAVVGYRFRGPSEAAKLGAIAVLVRSLTNHSLYTPHTGATGYEEGVPRIPAAAITVEDSGYIARQVAAGQRVVVELRMGAEERGTVMSGNVIAELRGSEQPEEIVVIGGHIDSWDVGQGAHDNGSGVVISMEALNLLRRLELRPRRTLRVVLWTNEENGIRGARDYAERHGAETHVAGIESDSGGAPVCQLHLSVGEADPPERALQRLAAITELLGPLGVDRTHPGFAGVDLSPLYAHGMPGVGLIHNPEHYFDVHHTEADTLDKIDPDALAQGVAAMAITAYVLADMPERLLD